MRSRASLLAMAMLLAAFRPGRAQAAPPVAAMKSQTPLIILAFKNTNGTTGSGTGTGFFVTPAHIVTNWHVCCMVPEGVTQKVVLAGRSQQELQPVTVLWSSQVKDLAVLKLEKPVDVAPVTFARFPSLSEGMDVWAVGYPGAAGRMAKSEGLFRSSLTKGVISKMDTRTAGSGQESVKLIQTDASINAGNSGGPLFDTCGRVVGVNVTKALVTVLDARGNPVRVPEADGIGWSVDIRELLPELDRMNVKYTAYDSACEAGGSSSSGGFSSLILAAQVILLLATVVVGAVVVRKKVAPAIVTAMTQRRYPAVPPQQPRMAQARQDPPQAGPPQGSAPPSPGPAAVPPKPVVRPKVTLLGLAGEYAGQRLPLLVQGLTMGRDAAVSNVVFASGTPGISKRHCKVYFDQGRVFVEDTYSSHGTFLGTGERLAPGQPRELQAGDEIRLADASVAFRLERNA